MDEQNLGDANQWNNAFTHQCGDMPIPNEVLSNQRKSVFCRHDNLEYVNYRNSNKSEYVNYEKQDIR